MTRHILKLASATLVGALIATPLLAMGPGGGHPAMSFEELDANADGQISAEEFQNARTARFATADSNGDGLMSRDEIVAAIQARAGDQADRMIKRFDANGDGSVALDEMPKPRNPEKMMKRLDKDGNGTISKEEFATMQKWQDRKNNKDR